MPRPASAVLPLAHAGLRLLIALNWLYGAGVLAMLVAMLADGAWTLGALGIPLAAQTDALRVGMRAIAALGLIAVPLNFAVLRRLLAMVQTVRDGDPFVAVNALRLQAIAWFLLVGELLSLAIGSVAASLSTPGHPLHLDAGFSLSGWLAVILTFVLARVFAAGTSMRADLEGTV